MYSGEEDSVKIKVMHLLHTYIPRLSGVAINTHAILTELAKFDGIECVVFGPHEKKFDVPVGESPYRIIRYVKSPSKFFLDSLFILCQLFSLYRKERFDILHCHGVDQMYFGTLFRKFVPSVVLLGMFRNDRMLKGGRRQLKRFKASLPFMDKIISINPEITNILLSQDPTLEKKIVEIPLGFDQRLYESIPSVATGEDRYIMYLGRLTGNKRLDVLINAFSLLRRDCPEVFLYIVGSGSDLDKLKLLARSLNIDDKVYFTGVKSGDEKIRLLQNAELFVFPSSAGEGLPGVLLEALACRKIIIANDYSTIKTLIKDGETGIIYKRNSPEDLAHKLLLGLRNRQKLEASFVPHINKMIPQYDVKVVASRYAELYRTLLGEKRGHKG